MRPRTLLAQVLAVNAILVAVTALVATLVAGKAIGAALDSHTLLLLFLAVASAALLNSILLRWRLEPVTKLIKKMEEADLSNNGWRADPPRRAASEVRDLTTGFNRILDRLEAERQLAARRVLDAQEKERKRIAQDLHDEVNQALTGILLRIEAVMDQAPAELKDELRYTKTLTNQAMGELIALARQLRPPELEEHGLLPTLRAQTTEFERLTKAPTHFIVHDQLPALTAEEQVAIYRITQESLSNIARHAHASEVTVELFGEDDLRLRIHDDGVGLNSSVEGGSTETEIGDGKPVSDTRYTTSATAVAPQQTSLGLSGMRERALLIGASLSIDSGDGQGTTVQLKLRDRQS